MLTTSLPLLSYVSYVREREAKMDSPIWFHNTAIFTIRYYEINNCMSQGVGGVTNILGSDERILHEDLPRGC